MRLQVRVQDTVQLHNWIRSLGPDAVVEAPAALRDRVWQDVQALAGLYGDDGPAGQVQQ
jgi:predicted DNA-binding transcriptional regulator YafY